MERKIPVWVDLLILFVSGTITLAVHFQGWKSRELANLDMLPYYSGAANFLKAGTIQEKGELSSYYSYNPPGTFYLMIPGALLTADPRLEELAGTALMIYATLFFLYLTAREIAGRVVAVPAAAIFGLSRLGFIGLWPVGHPLFIVASLFFILLWIKRRTAWAFAACLAVLAFGLYVDLAIIPFLFILPVLWLIYRPPLGWKSLLASALFGLIVWFPYLRYESQHGFADIAALLLLRPVDTVWDSNPSPPVYCYAADPGENDEPNDLYLPYVGGPEIQQRVIYPEAGWKNGAAYDLCRFLLNIDRNFDTDLFLLGPSRILNSVLWWIFMAGWMTLVWVVLRSGRLTQRIIQAVAVKRKWIPLALAAGGALLVYLLTSPDLLAHFAADQSVSHNILLAVIQFRDFAPWIWLAIFLGLFFSVFIPDRNPDNPIVLVAFSIPWILLVILGEPGKPERFWYMWPLQILIMIMFLRWVAERYPKINLVYSLSILALGVALLPLPFFSQRISDGWAHGYAGTDNDQWKVVEFLAGEAKSEGVNSLRVSYWMADTSSPMNPLRPGDRISDWFDYLLLVRSGVHNLEGASPGGPKGTWEVVDTLVGVPDSLRGLSPVAMFGHYRVYQLP
jgi:hypothetical protein